MKAKRSKVKVGESLTEGLVIGVLSRLPVKSLLRFRGVSTHWCALIGSSHFAAIHDQCSDPNSCALLQHAISPFADAEKYDGVLLLRNKSTIVSLDLPFLECENRKITLDLVGSNNGLVYLNLFDKEGVDQTRIVVWNPSINQFRYLPELASLNDHGNYHPGTVLGLGFVDDSTDYKLVRLGVRICMLNDSFTRVRILSQVESCMLDGSFPRVRILSQVHIYTRSTNSWRKMKKFPFCVLQDCDPITLNGMMYVLATKCELNPLKFVLSFNLLDEVFHEIPVPPYDTPSAKLFSWKKSLTFVAHDYVLGRWEFYVMAQESEIGTENFWTKQLSIPTSVGRLVGIWHNQILVGKSDESTEYDEELCLYDPRSQMIRELTYDEHEPKYGYDVEKAINYVESLVPV